MERCVIWGTGKSGGENLKKFISMEYDVYAFCDSDITIAGQRIAGIDVIKPEELTALCDSGSIDCIIIGISKKEYVEQVKFFINNNIPNSIRVLDWEYIHEVLEKPMLAKRRSNINYQWNIDFEKQVIEWSENLMTEVAFWVEDVAKVDGVYHLDYMERLSNREFSGLDPDIEDFSKKFPDDAVVMDIGCGLVSKYGEYLPDSRKIKLIQVDPLAAYYNIINRQYSNGCKSNTDCQFGLFEFIANFYEEDCCDAIIINNALDHCIDPYKALVECLFILKPDGMMRLNHRIAEAVFENNCGLHKWNIDYNSNKNLIIWNHKNAINVSKELENIADIKVMHSDNCIPRNEQNIIVEIKKKIHFSLNEFIDIEKERMYLACFIKHMMAWSSRNNIVFNNL